MKTKTSFPSEGADDALELIFQNRNKGYGAYQLRREYPAALRRALVGGVSLVLLGIALPYVSNALADKNAIADKVTTTCFFDDDIIIEKIAPPPMPKVVTPPPPPVAHPTQKFVPPKVMVDNEVEAEEKIATTDELKVADPATVTKVGDPNSNTPAIVEPSDLGTTAVEVVKPAPKEEIFLRVEQMPQFPGGETEMLRFLRDNIRYPAIAYENGIEGTVVVKFVVNQKGEITDLNVVKEVAGGCSEEAVRVIKKMPEWSPGKQNGRVVKVWFTLPVRFKLS